jgi:hypothetical protein
MFSGPKDLENLEKMKELRIVIMMARLISNMKFLLNLKKIWKIKKALKYPVDFLLI